MFLRVKIIIQISLSSLFIFSPVLSPLFFFFFFFFSFFHHRTYKDSRYTVRQICSCVVVPHHHQGYRAPPTLLLMLENGGFQTRFLSPESRERWTGSFSSNLPVNPRPENKRARNPTSGLSLSLFPVPSPRLRSFLADFFPLSPFYCARVWTRKALITFPFSMRGRMRSTLYLRFSN